jgi:protein associated with RNAse G/E
MESPDQVTIRVLKYDGTEYRRWNARLSQNNSSLLVLDAEFEHDVQHDLLGAIPGGTRTIEYYWLDRWYNIFRFVKDDNTTRLYYCNINMPPSLADHVLTYIDLDIDILVQPDFSYQVLDLDEFEENARRYGYSEEVKSQARAAVDEVVSMIVTHQFPFIENVLSSSVSSVVN